MGRLAPPKPVAVRPHVNTRCAPYPRPIDLKLKDELGEDARRFRAPARTGTFDSLDTPISPDSAISPDSPDYERRSKWKDEGVDDPDAERRRKRVEEAKKKAEAAKKKAEEEEQERLDFFQML